MTQKRRAPPRVDEPSDDDSEESIEELVTTSRLRASGQRPTPEKRRTVTNAQRAHMPSPSNLTSPTNEGNANTSTVIPTVTTATNCQASTCSDLTDGTERQDYRLLMAPKSANVVLQSVINTVLFRKVKFFVLSEHDTYSLDASTVCGLLVKSCNVNKTDAAEWWHNVKNKICRLLTDHRNNVIKSMRKHYKGECL